jgi:hypothetical protein
VAFIISAWVEPLVHNRPEFVGCNRSPDTRAMTGRPPSLRVCTSIPQPTPQYEHAVLVTAMRSGFAWPVPVRFR